MHRQEFAGRRQLELANNDRVLQELAENGLRLKVAQNSAWLIRVDNTLEASRTSLKTGE